MRKFKTAGNCAPTGNFKPAELPRSMDKSAVLSRMQALCSSREYCTRDITEKLRKYMPEISPEDEEDIIASLRKDKFLDDLRYASAFCRDKSSIQGWGPVKIRYALSSKGIPSSVIAEALGEIDPEKASLKLKKMLEAKARTLEGDPQKKYKLIKFALGRGYDPSDLDL